MVVHARVLEVSQNGAIALARVIESFKGPPAESIVTLKHTVDRLGDGYVFRRGSEAVFPAHDGIVGTCAILPASTRVIDYFRRSARP